MDKKAVSSYSPSLSSSSEDEATPDKQPMDTVEIEVEHPKGSLQGSSEEADDSSSEDLDADGHLKSTGSLIARHPSDDGRMEHPADLYQGDFTTLVEKAAMLSPRAEEEK